MAKRKGPFPTILLVGIIILCIGVALIAYKAYTNSHVEYPTPSISDQITKVVYINLEKRKDRRDYMENIFLKAFPPEKVIRFNAIENKDGAVGCGLSHLAVLEMAEREGWDNVLILEDDVMWKNVKSGQPVFENLIQKEYDVIMLGTTFLEYDKPTYRIKRALAGSSYLVNRMYYKKLIQFVKQQQQEGMYTIDYIYTYVQPTDKWYAVVPNMCIQRDGYSNIRNKKTSYNSNFSHN